MKNPELQNLTDYSPSDAPWDAHRSVSDDVGGIYLLAAEYERYGARMASCGGLLRFGWSTLKETGETRLRLREAHFCRPALSCLPVEALPDVASPFLPVPAAYRGGLPQCPLDVPDPDRAQLCDRGAGRDAEPDEHGFPAAEGSKRVPTSSGMDPHHGSHPRQ